ncbi:hypothetical protein EBZ38_03310 [bacterium]|nr:hypothetical protein [bacterium]NDC93990.1 hypothetical protein [bacterium]NDD83295.1 hypothetical protein [bacterium]
MNLESLFHNIDKRLAVIEALSEAHAVETTRQMEEIKIDLEKMREEVSRLKVRVAGISASVSIVVGVLFKFWSN